MIVLWTADKYSTSQGVDDHILYNKWHYLGSGRKAALSAYLVIFQEDDYLRVDRLEARGYTTQ